MNIKTCVRVPSAVLVGIVTALGLTACGGGSSSTTATTTDTTPTAVETITGQFIDAAVAGLAYSCSSGSTGVTDSNGIYTCNMGDTVTFSINGFDIGSTTASKLITPYTLATAATADTTQATTIAINIAQLLQTLDDDNDPSNGISIAQSGAQYDALATMATDNIPLTLDDFDTTVAAYIGETLIDETTAQTHLDDTIDSLTFVAADIQAAMAGKSLYPAKPSPYWEEWIVDVDGVTITAASGYDEWGYWNDFNGTISYTDTSFTVTPPVVDADNPVVTFQVIAITADYIDTNLGKIYFSYSDAYPASDNIIASVAGKKLYPQQFSRAYSQEWAFDATADNAVVTGVDEFGAFTDNVTFTYSGDTFTATNTDLGEDNTPRTFTVLAVSSTEIRVLDPMGNEFGIYFTQEDAYVGLP